MLKATQINGIFEKFFDPQLSNQNLVLNYISDEILAFYEYVIHYYCHKFNYKITNTDKGDLDDLFETRSPLNLLIKPKSKDIEDILSSNQKNILVCDYKTFIRYSKQQLSINCYNYKNDLKNFITNILDIKNNNLMDGLLDNPHYIYSETSKFSINSKYNFTIIDDLKLDFIAHIRKEYYDSRSKSFNLVKLFDLIKSEYFYKKFNFLTY